LAFSSKKIKEALEGVKKVISVENNLTSQLSRLFNFYGFNVDEKILRYDGRPFSLEELEEELKKRL
jgi:2-oxoglutarate ferredoxin oxidoreductase subunit alpha